MSVLEDQNLLGGNGNPHYRGVHIGASRLSFGPSMSKKGAAGSSEAGAFLYNSPSRSYAPDIHARDTFGQPTGISPLGVDGTAVVKGQNTKYGPGDTEGVIAKMTNGDTSLLTGLAKVMSGRPKQPKYEAIDYFTTRTPRSTRSYHNTANPGGNEGGSGAQRKYYHASATYPDEILTTGSGAEYVPLIPGGTSGLMNLIPLTPGGGDGSEDQTDPFNAVNHNEDQAALANGETNDDGNQTSSDPGVEPTSTVDSVIEVSTSSGMGWDDATNNVDLSTSEGNSGIGVYDGQQMGSGSPMGAGH